MRKLPIAAVVRLTAPIWRIVYSKWFGTALFLCLVIGTVFWFAAQERLPRNIQIATGAENGQYHLYGSVLAASMQARTGRDVSAIVTDGSVENQQRITAGKADLAIIQHGAVPMSQLVVIAPLYEDVVHVVVRKGRGIQSIHDLADRNVVLGPKGSGMRVSAIEILDHYGVNPESLGDKSESYFLELASDETLDAAIVTTGYVNADLKTLLASGSFELLDVNDADALSLRHAHLTPTTIPRSLYHEGPAVPERTINTVATTALLVASSKVPAPLVEEAVVTLYEDYPHWESGDSQRKISRMMNATEAAQWAQLPLHPVTRNYFEPYKGLVLLKDFMESIVATKDLLFTLGAGIYVLWLWRRKVAKRRSEAELAIHMQKLNALLDETVRIETQQMKTCDPKELQGYLDEVTRVKLRALDELTDQDLRGDQMFTIFLTQCSNLSRKLQLKIRLPVDRES
jgi:TRAP transporter TAXI family solute receptor